MSILELNGLTKQYTRLSGPAITAVDNLSLHIDKPGVHGFLGPNGSGKTTTIRCLLALVRPTSGQTRIFGVDTTTQLHTVIDRVGALVETPKFFPPFSARRNLDLLARVGHATSSDIERALETVGLTDRANDSFKSYSLGMKQRLAVAATLLKNPDLIILDEPANGLDPQGIKEMRDLVRALGADGRAVFVSSHQLGEIQQVCDTVTIIQDGRLIAAGAVDDIVAAASAASNVVITIDDPAAAIATLDAAGISSGPGEKPSTVQIDLDPKQSATITKVLADAGLYLRGMVSNQVTLEEAFLTLTGGGQRAGATTAPSPHSALPPPPHATTTPSGTPSDALDELAWARPPEPNAPAGTPANPQDPAGPQDPVDPQDPADLHDTVASGGVDTGETGETRQADR